MTARVLRDRENGLTNPVVGNGQTLPGYLRQLRISRHYRQNFVASKLNISRQTYSHYETGRIRPPAGALYGLAKLYGIPVENLLSCMMFGRYGIENPREGHGSLEQEGRLQDERVEEEGLKQEGPGLKNQKHEKWGHADLKQEDLWHENPEREGLEPKDLKYGEPQCATPGHGAIKQEDLWHENPEQEGLEYRDSKYKELQCKDTEDENPLGYDLGHKGTSRMEGQLLSYFRSLNEKDKEDILSIARLKTRNRGEKEDQNAECKATV